MIKYSFFISPKGYTDPANPVLYMLDDKGTDMTSI